MPNLISAPEALRLLLQGGSVRAVDVRSEGEFATASVPGFVNLPILTNQERHEVGTCYKQKGQEAAIALGHKLVDPQREQRAAAWKSALEGAEFPLVTCFRGGLRSQISCDWIKQAQQNAIRIEGGYKAMRQELLGAIGSVPESFIVAGPTGSGKTKLLRSVSAPSLDLELHANHKGSSFGASPVSAQPAQASFENALGFNLLKLNAKQLLLEDESAMIGRVCVPEPVRRRIAQSPVIRIRMSAEERTLLLYEEYVAEPLQRGIPFSTLLQHYREATKRIESRLGGQAASALLGKLELAFTGRDPELHYAWIHDLLALYYDKAYDYSFRKIPRETAFEGSWQECKQWIQDKFA